MSNFSLEAEVRQKIIEAIRKDLMGPSSEDEVLYGRPNVEYLTGMLYPENPEKYDEHADNDYGLDENKYDSSNEEENEETPVNDTLSNTTSIGLSFYIEKKTKKIVVKASWGDYFSQKKEDAPDDLFDLDEKSKEDKKKKRDKTVYCRKQNSEEIEIDLSTIKRTKSSRCSIDPQVEITLIKYDLKNDYSLVSVFLTNRRPFSNELASIMFQAKLEVFNEDGFISESYARNNNSLDEYYYLEKPIFARGRGCAADWISNGMVCNHISTEFIPEQEINKVSADFDEFEKGFFSTLKFSSEKSKDKIISDLYVFTNKYQEWINNLKASPKKKLFSNNMCRFDEIINTCQNACDRINAGIKILNDDEVAFKAFCVMNQTIYLQNAIKRYAKKHGSGVVCNFSDFSNPRNPENQFNWRPFQLAFILLNIKGIVNPFDEERKIVDLLYFPTGGGKTEAYLGLMAFTIFNRRLRKSSVGEYELDGGVTIILRYTLRLLTTQQRDRLTKMIMAAEYIRDMKPEVYGNERISIGFWVGDGVVSNTFDDFIPSKNDDETQAEVKKRNAAKQIPTCPFCGKPLNYYSEKDPNHNEIENSFIFDTERQELKVYCVDKTCHFAKYPEKGVARSLPIYLVDDEIYNKCPTILLGTVDKFAKLPWEPKTNALFGRVHKKCGRHGFIAMGDLHSYTHNATANNPKSTSCDVKKFLPPELIVQDELHLITGPLGTIYGGYETMIEKLCSYEKNGKIVKPKYIVSTATIKNADEQIKALYGRKHFQFPPAGLEVSDSYFIREVPLEQMPFRKYVGICANGQSMKTTLLRTFAVAMQEVKNLSLNPSYLNSIDPYYTLVGYFNSIRELGGAARLIEDDIPKRLYRICKMRHYNDRRFISNHKEITSRIKSDEIKRELDSLEIPWTPTNNKAIDAVIATNMIAVGMDVDRLGLMCVLGQPKQNSEYIQATSRIGRSHPGLVITLYNPYRPRDLSHYENFIAYHKQLYRYVEGTTATPFAARARDRFLHALVICAIRLLYPDMSIGADKIVDLKPKDIDYITSIITDRVGIVDPSAINDAKHEIVYFINEWKRLVQAGNKVVYRGQYAEDKIRLMVPYADEHKDTEKGTLQSMRDVDQNSVLYLYEEV